MAKKNIQLDGQWLAALESEFEQPYMTELKAFLRSEKQAGKTIYPSGALMFNAFHSTPLEQVNVVILGQDPYHGPGQAHGLSFSVPKKVALPPSLKNIYKAIELQTGATMPSHGCLQSWAEQGVLLLNATLSVEKANAGSHQKKGWERFTDKAISVVSERCEHVVFMLWGAYARKKVELIDARRHCVLESVHPSPLSAHRGFFANQHFSRANEYLQAHGRLPINWAMH